MWIAFLVNLTAYPFTGSLLPYIARNVHHTDQTGLGYMSASFAFGALAASMVLSNIGGVKLARLMIVSTAIWYVLLIVFAHMQTMPTAIACLVMAGFAQSFSMITLAVILLRTAGERFRGRVMGVRMMAIYSLPIGLLIAGPLDRADGICADGDDLCGRRPVRSRCSSRCAGARTCGGRSRRRTRFDIASWPGWSEAQSGISDR